MGQSRWACAADTITNDDLEKICSLKLMDLTLILERNKIKWQTFFSQAKHEDGNRHDNPFDEVEDENGEEQERIWGAWEALQTDFMERTGMSLYAVYKSELERGDELPEDGAFAVWGTTTASPEYLRMKADHGVSVEVLAWTDWG